MDKAWLKTMGLNLGLALVVTAAARAGLSLAMLDPRVTPLWPPAGLAVAAVVYFGQRLLPGVWLGAAAAAWTNATPLPVAMLQALGDTAGAALSAWLALRFAGGLAPFARWSHAVLLLPVALAGSAVCALTGTFALVAAGIIPAELKGGVFLTWWLGNTVSIVLLAPPVLAWLRPGSSMKVDGRERAGFLVLAGLSTWLLLVWLGAVVGDQVLLPYVSLVLVGWAVFRYTQREVSLTLLVVGAAAVWSFQGNRRFLDPAEANLHLLNLQAFLALAAVMGYGMARVVEQQRETHQDLIQVLDANAMLTRQLSVEAGTLVDLIGAGVVVYDAQKRVIERNAKAGQLMQGIMTLGPDGAMSLLPGACLSRENGEPLALGEGKLAEAMATGKTQTEVLCFRDPAGRELWVNLQIDPVLGADGRAERFVSTFQDVTERRREQERLEALKDHQAESQRMESLGLMAAGVAHDFNNLLTIVLGNLGLALNRMDKPEAQRRNLEAIGEAARKAADLASQIQAFGGKGGGKNECLDLGALAGETLRLMRTNLPPNIRMASAEEQGTPAVFGDPVSIRRMVMNLLVNAREAVEHHGGEINLTVARAGYMVPAALAGVVAPKDAPAGEYVVLEVSDNGAGIPPDTLKRIFEPFFSTKFVGRGLGLAASLGTLKAHQGFMQVESALGRGAAFRAHIPVSDRCGQPQPAAAAPRSGQTLLRGQGKVLLVEDEPQVAALAEEALSAAGFMVLSASTGEAAFRHLVSSSTPPVAVVLDLSLPDMDGDKVLLTLREAGLRAPVLLVTGLSYHDWVSRRPVERPQGFLKKPYLPDDLIEALRRAAPEVFRA